MNSRENMLRAMHFEHPEHIPVTFAVSEGVFRTYDPHELEELFEAHPIIAGKHCMRWDLVPKEGETINHEKYYTDAFGVEWKGVIDGIRGVIQKHPLEDFSLIPDYKFPKVPDFNVEEGKKNISEAKKNGHYTAASLEHGHTFLRLTDLCGYENVLYGMYDDDENLKLLIQKLEDYNYAFIDYYSKLGYDSIGFPEDLGMQVGPMISPDLFRKYIKPSYQRLMKPARESGAIIHMHSDGDIRTLADDLVDGGVDVLNLQDLVNGIDWIRDRFYGKYAIDLDIDRQNVTVFGTPADVDALIREEVTKLSSPAGGLSMIFGWYSGTPIKNIWALMDALEKYMFMWD